MAWQADCKAADHSITTRKFLFWRADGTVLPSRLHGLIPDPLSSAEASTTALSRESSLTCVASSASVLRACDGGSRKGRCWRREFMMRVRRHPSGRAAAGSASSSPSRQPCQYAWSWRPVPHRILLIFLENALLIKVKLVCVDGALKLHPYDESMKL